MSSSGVPRRRMTSTDVARMTFCDITDPGERMPQTVTPLGAVEPPNQCAGAGSTMPFAASAMTTKA